MKRARVLGTVAAAILAGGLLSGCSPTISNHGHIPDPELMKEIRIGKTTENQVRNLLGTPSTVAPFDKKAWYYIGDRTSQIAFLDPEILKREVVIIHFDDKGVVRQVEKLNKKDGRDVQLVERKTPTRGKELTILEQLIGNIGRFGGSESDSAGDVGAGIPGPGS